MLRSSSTPPLVTSTPKSSTSIPKHILIFGVGIFPRLHIYFLILKETQLKKMLTKLTAAQSSESIFRALSWETAGEAGDFLAQRRGSEMPTTEPVFHQMQAFGVELSPDRRHIVMDL